MQLLSMRYVKGQVQQAQMPQPFRERRRRISQAMANASESHFLRTWEEIEYRVDLCTVNNRAHIEYLYISFMSFHAILKLFNVCICNPFENTPIYFHPNYLEEPCTYK
jgi:hypothetical protein